MKQLCKLAILTSALLATTAFASSKVILDFQNCTNKNVSVKWEGYNFSFNGEVGKDESTHGTFSVAPGNTTKTMFVHFDPIPEGHVKVHLTGGVSADFKVEQTFNPLGGLEYITASNRISFKHLTNAATRITANNTVKIGC